MHTLPAPSQPPIRPAPLPARPHPGLPLDEMPRRGRSSAFQRLRAVLYRARWFLPLPLALGVAGGLWAARHVRPEYVARSTIWIDAQPAREGERSSGPLRSADLLQSRAWVELLRSFTVLDPVVRRERLYLTYSEPADSAVFAGFAVAEKFRPGDYRLTVNPGGRTFRLATRAGLTLQRGRVGDAVGAAAGFTWRPAPAALRRRRDIDFTVETPRDAAVRLQKRLVTNMAENGTFLRLELAGTEPDRITATLNALTERYVAVAGELKRAKLRELERILGQQLQYAAGSLQREEGALQGFRIQTITLPADRGSPVTPGLEVTQDPVFNNFFNLNMEREQIQRDRDEIARAMALGGTAGTTALEAIPSVQKSSALNQALQELTAKRAELRAMQGQFTEIYQPLQRLKGQVETLERQTLPQLAQRLDAELAGRQQGIDRLVSSASTQLRGIPPRAIEEARLRRRVAIAEELYKLLEQRYEEARLSMVTTIPDVRVLDPATVPFQPTRDPRVELVLLFTLAGLALGLAGAVVYDRANPRLTYPEQVTEGLGLPILGAIPRARASVGSGKEVPPELPEAFRSLRLGLSHAGGADGPLAVTISSPGSGDGKSFVSANLALTFAEQGYRVVLLDADLRRGALHQLLGCRRKPGLADYLTGQATVAEVVQNTPYPRVDFVAGGTRAGRGPELLGTAAMSELLAELRAQYDVVLVDSPPMGACVDPLMLATLTRDMLLVLRNGTTDRQLAEWNLELVDRLPIRVLGAVVNGINPRGAYRGYGYLHGYDYQPVAEDLPPRLQPA